MIDKALLRSKSGQVPFTRTFYSRKRIYGVFLLPQAKSRTFLWSKIVSSLEQHKSLLNRIWSRLNNVKKVVVMSLQVNRGGAC